MTTQPMTSPRLLAFFGAAAFVLAAAAPAQAAELSADDVRKIVHEYIMEHPDVILNSVNEYQTRSVQERQTAAVKSNYDQLFQDERSPFIGNEKGDVHIVEFFDYNCGYCKRVVPDLTEIIESDKNVRIIFKDLPILGPTSETAAKWALAAQKQGKYFEYHQKLMTHQGPYSDEVLAKYAKDVGLDVDRARKDTDSTDVLIQIERNRSLAAQMNIQGTPAFVIGEEIIPGAVNKNTLIEKIAEQRKRNAAAKEEKKEDGKKKE